MRYAAGLSGAHGARGSTPGWREWPHTRWPNGPRCGAFHRAYVYMSTYLIVR